jgi:hypothetical protein
MTKEQVAQLLGEIKGIYGNKFELNENTPVMWFKHMSDVDFEVAFKTIDIYAENERFPPTISDFKMAIGGYGRHSVPGVEETKEFIAEMRRAAEAKSQRLAKQKGENS